MPDGESVLGQVAAAGYAGIDLGPVGYLGHGDELGEALARRGLGLAGAYVELPYSDPDALEERHGRTRRHPRRVRRGAVLPDRAPAPADAGRQGQ